MVVWRGLLVMVLLLMLVFFVPGLVLPRAHAGEVFRLRSVTLNAGFHQNGKDLRSQFHWPVAPQEGGTFRERLPPVRIGACEVGVKIEQQAHEVGVSLESRAGAPECAGVGVFSVELEESFERVHSGEALQWVVSDNSFGVNGVFPVPARSKRKNAGESNLDVTEPIGAGGSFWATAIRMPDSGPEGRALVRAAISAEHQKIRFWAHQSGNHVVLRTLFGDDTVSKPLAQFQVDPLWVSDGVSVQNQLLEYRQHRIRAYGRNPGSPESRSIPGFGWSSWYELFQNIDEASLLSILRSLQNKFQNLVRERIPDGFVFQIDDGYVRRWGDWGLPDPVRFPNGLAPLAKETREAGFVPGIWLAPFLVDQGSEAFRILKERDPAIFLRNHSGETIVFKGNGGRDHVILDVSHPGAQEFVLSSVQQFRQMGFRHFKLDFLFLAAAEARNRKNPALSGVAAYQLMLRRIRDSLDRDADRLGSATLSLSGAISLPALDSADFFRTGPDIAYSNRPGRATLAMVKAQLLATASHWPFSGGRLRPDADAIVIRNQGAGFNKRLALQVAMTGGLMFSSDDPRRNHRDESLFLDPKIVKLNQSTEVVVPLDFWDHPNCLARKRGMSFGPGLFYRPPERWLAVPRTGTGVPATRIRLFPEPEFHEHAQ